MKIRKNTGNKEDDGMYELKNIAVLSDCKVMFEDGVQLVDMVYLKWER